MSMITSPWGAVISSTTESIEGKTHDESNCKELRVNCENVIDVLEYHGLTCRDHCQDGMDHSGNAPGSQWYIDPPLVFCQMVYGQSLSAQWEGCRSLLQGGARNTAGDYITNRYNQHKKVIPCQLQKRKNKHSEENLKLVLHHLASC